MPKDKNIVNEEPQQQNFQGKTILDTQKGSPYEKYSVLYLGMKGLQSVGIIAKFLDDKYKIPVKIPDTTIDPKTGKEEPIMIDDWEHPGQKKQKMKANPASYDTRMNDLMSELNSSFDLDQERKAQEKFVVDPSTPEIFFKIVKNEKELNQKVSGFFKEILDEYQKYAKEHENDKDFTCFKTMLDLNMLPLDFEKGDYIKAIGDSPYLQPLMVQNAASPMFGTIPFHELREALDGEGKPLPLMNDYYQGVYNLFELEYEKQRLLENHPGPDERKAYLGKLKDGMQKMVDAYDKMYAFNEKNLDNPDYKQNVYLNNNLDHITGVAPSETRAPVREIGQLRAQIKAIENGWDIEELASLGVIGALKSDAETSVRKADYKIQQEKKSLDDAEARYQKKIGDVREKYDKAKNEYDTLNRQVNSIQAEIQKETAALKKQPDAAKEKALAEKKNSLRPLQETLGQKEKALKDADKQLNAVEAPYQKAKEKYENEIKRKEQNQKLLKDIQKLEEDVVDKKVSSAWEKREALIKIQEFRQKSLDNYPLANTRLICYDQSKNLNKDALDKVEKDLFAKEFPEDWKKKGIPEEMGDARQMLSNAVDIFGPHPRHHADWEKGVIPKALFDEKLKPYDMSGIPFSDTEFAYMSMAYASLDRPDTFAALKTFKPDSNKERLNHNAFWTDDIFSSKKKPRDNVSAYSTLAENARRGAMNAAQAYVAGDKKPVAEIIHKGLSLQTIQANATGSAGTNSAMCNYGRTKVFLDMLNRDPELMREFQAINEKAPKEEQVDLNQQKGYLNYLGVIVGNLSAGYEMERNPSMPKERREELNKMKRKGEVLSELQVKEGTLFQIDPTFMKGMNDFQAKNAHLQTNATLPEYVVKLKKFQEENTPKSQMFKLFETEEGRKKFDEFVDHMYQKYGQEGMSFSDMVSSSDQAKAEVGKFLLDRNKERILDRLSKEPMPDENEIGELAAAFLQNETASRKYEEFLNGGQLDPLAKALGTGQMSDRYVPDYHKKLLGMVKDMDFRGMSPSEFEKVLTSPTAREMSEQLYNAANLPIMQSEQESGPKMDDAVQALKDGNKGTWFGKADYDKVLSDLNALNQAYAKNQKALLKNGPSGAIPDLAKKQEELLKGMDAYIRRKEEEFKRNKAAGKEDNRNSRRRYEAMKKAKNDLEARIKFDKKYDQMVADAAEFQANRKEAAEMNAKVPKEDIVKKVSEKTAKASMEKLTNLMKEGIDASEKTRKTVRTALAAMVLNEQVQSSKDVAESMPVGAEKYAEQVKRLANSPQFDKCLPKELNSQNVSEFLADKNGARKLLNQFKSNLNREAEQAMNETRKELAEMKEAANKKKSHEATGKEKMKGKAEPEKAPTV